MSHLDFISDNKKQQATQHADVVGKGTGKRINNYCCYFLRHVLINVPMWCIVYVEERV